MDFFYHYFEKERGPFLNLSDMNIPEAQSILDGIKKESNTFAAQRYDGYLERRHELEQQVRNLFIAKGGKPVRLTPHYMVVEECPWLNTWYRNGQYVKIPVCEFDIDTVSFTYGDMFPTFSPRVTDGKEYRKCVYTHAEILEIIEKYGLPQVWNGDGRFGPERYVEAHVWSDDTISEYLHRCLQ